MLLYVKEINKDKRFEAFFVMEQKRNLGKRIVNKAHIPIIWIKPYAKTISNDIYETYKQMTIRDQAI